MGTEHCLFNWFGENSATYMISLDLFPANDCKVVLLISPLSSKEFLDYWPECFKGKNKGN